MSNLYSVKIQESKKLSFGEIITDGYFSEKVSKQMLESDESLNETTVNGIFSNAVNILNNCPNPKDSGDFKRTGIIIGKVQSGKTSNFISLIALAFDNGYNIAVVIGGNTLELLTQNVKRIETAFNIGPEKLVVLHSKDNYNLITPEKVRRHIENNVKVIIISLKAPQEKNKKHMSRVSELFDDSFMSRENTLIIDDEGDQATLNSKVYSKDRELASTYKVATELKEKIKRHCFISVTATPQANILIKTSDILSPDFGNLIYPGEGYCGLSVFHGDDQDKYIKVISEKEESLLDSDEVIPMSFVEAITSFFVSNAIRKNRGDGKIHSMLIHPSHKRIDHKKVQERIDKYLKHLRDIISLGKDDMSYKNELKPQLLNAYDKYREDGVLLDDYDNYEDEIIRCIKMSSDVLIFNSESINPREDAKKYSTRIYLGGNILDRGITIPGLAITYIIRRAKGTSNVDNVEQRARWFGYKNVPFVSDYIDICRVWATEAIKRDFSSIYESDDDMWSSIERNLKKGKPFKDLPRYFLLQHEASHRLRLTRPNVAKTQEVSWTEWKTQKYYVSDKISAERNLKLLENLRLKTSGEYIDSGGVNKHYFAYDFPLKDFIDNVFGEYIFHEKELFDKTLFDKILELINKSNLDADIDIVWLRVDSRETRQINSDGTIQQLFRGRDIRGRDGNINYLGDRSTCDARPDKIQIQIHYVKDSSLSDNNYYSPALCIYVPEKYATRLVGRKDDE